MQCELVKTSVETAVGFYDDENDFEGSPADESDLEFEELPCTDEDDARWDAFIPDEDECDPEPEAGDFWIESRGSQKSKDESQESDGL